MRDFKKLKVWQKGVEIAVKTFKLTAGFPKEEKYGLTSQLNRASVSISSNIAEGSGRGSYRDYRRFIEISLGSCFEMETQLLIAEAVSIGEPGLRAELLNDIDQEQKMLIRFRDKLQP